MRRRRRRLFRSFTETDDTGGNSGIRLYDSNATIE
jgi:hypothetical protein